MRLSKIFGMMENIKKVLENVGPQKIAKGMGILIVLIVLVYIPAVTIALIDDSSIILVNLGVSDLAFPFMFLATLTFVPVLFVYWAVIYNFNLLYSKEINFIGMLTESISENQDMHEMIPVLPLVEENSPVIYWISEQESIHSIYRCNPCRHNLHRYRILLKMLSLIKAFHLEVNICYNELVVILIFGGCFLLPLMFAVVYFPDEEFTKNMFYLSSPSANSFWIIATFAPILLCEWNRNMNEYLALKTSKLIYSGGKPCFGNLLSRLTFMARDQYSESPWSFISLDYHLLSVVIDFVVLFATTFIIP
ncbi:hypothetical protein J6590_016752 [Homalodisca vitripennis]|nr:hypothetical protein J6590_016752 [Homalodisca vitripennis]